MTFEKPINQWDELDKEDREYMNLVRKIDAVLANDPNKFIMYLQTNKPLYNKLYKLLHLNMDYGVSESE